MKYRIFISGLIIWAVATIALRFVGEHVLRPGNWVSVLLLFIFSFPLMAWLARAICLRANLPHEQWPIGSISLAMPTLLLDPFSCIFFSEMFPKIAPEMAGVFGGWLLWCCAGAMTGALLPTRRHS
jgi:xanthine/uracil permease